MNLTDSIYLKVDFNENLGICIRHLLQPFLRNKKIIFKFSIASISFFCNPFIFIQTSYLILLLLHCLTNLTQLFAQMGEKRFWTNSKSEMQFFQESGAKCAKMVFFGIFGASAHLNGGTQIFYFTANPSLGILFQRWEVENPFKITFSPYFGLKFTICHIPVIIESRDISKL